MIGRNITSAISAMFIEDLNLERMTRSNVHPGKTGLNREMRYSRMGSFRDEVAWQAEKAGVKVVKLKARDTSTTCMVCVFVDKRSQDSESFTYTFCGWHHHADKNAASNLLLIGCLRPETGGKAHHQDSGAASAGLHVVVRREDRERFAHHRRKKAGRLGPSSDIHGKWSDRAPRFLCTRGCRPDAPPPARFSRTDPAACQARPAQHPNLQQNQRPKK